jgi:hypothetical protein
MEPPGHASDIDMTDQVSENKDCEPQAIRTVAYARLPKIQELIPDGCRASYPPLALWRVPA